MVDRLIQQTFRLLLYMVLTTMVLSTFLANWSFLDGTNWNSLKVTLDGTAHQPVVYRRLMPETVNLIRSALPRAAKQILSETVAPQFYQFYTRPLIAYYEKDFPSITKQASLDWEDPEYRVSYVLMYYLCWVFLFLSLIVMRHTVSFLGTGADATMAGVRECAPVFAVLCLPFSFLNGGYFYDFGEYFLLNLALYASLSGNFVMLVVSLILAAINKETAWIFAIYLSPIWHQKWGTKKTVVRLVLIVSFLLFVSLAIQSRYASNPGSGLGLALFNNIHFWTEPSNWWAVGDHIGRGFYIPRLMLLPMLASGLVYGLKYAPTHISVAAVVSLVGTSLLLLFIGFRDELRNLSLSFPLFYAFIVSAYLERYRRGQAVKTL